MLLQTFSPSHYVYRFASHYDYPGFFAKENNTRKVTGFPPYSTIVRVLFSSEIEEKANRLHKERLSRAQGVRGGA